MAGETHFSSGQATGVVEEAENIIRAASKEIEGVGHGGLLRRFGSGILHFAERLPDVLFELPPPKEPPVNGFFRAHIDI